MTQSATQINPTELAKARALVARAQQAERDAVTAANAAKAKRISDAKVRMQEIRQVNESAIISAAKNNDAQALADAVHNAIADVTDFASLTLPALRAESGHNADMHWPQVVQYTGIATRFSGVRVTHAILTGCLNLSDDGALALSSRLSNTVVGEAIKKVCATPTESAGSVCLLLVRELDRCASISRRDGALVFKTYGYEKKYGAERQWQALGLLLERGGMPTDPSELSYYRRTTRHPSLQFEADE